MLEVAKARYKVCQACDQFRQVTRTCASCGCFLPLKVVAPFLSCPLNRWTS